MPDQITKVTKTGWGSRLGNSFKGILIGILLFFGSFVLLYWNEGRVDVSEIAVDAIEISSTEQNTNAEIEGKLVSTTGVLESDETIGDGMYLLPGKYVSVKRVVEMYSWKERSSSKTEKHIGGSETTETTYTYTKGWEETVQNSNNFEEPSGHFNPEKSIDEYEEKVNFATVGVYTIEPKDMRLPKATTLVLSDGVIDTSLMTEDDEKNIKEQQENTKNKESGYDAMQNDIENEKVSSDTVKTVKSGNYIFVGKGSLSQPEIGDLRIKYEVLRPGVRVTVFGKLSGNSILSFIDKDGTKLYRAFSGNRDEAIQTMHSEYKTMLWILRIAGFLIMWIGLSMVLSPLSVFFDVLPFLGSVSRFAVGIVTFLVAFALSFITIIISMILHSLLAVIVAVVVVIVLIYLYIKKNSDKIGSKISKPDLKQK